MYTLDGISVVCFGFIVLVSVVWFCLTKLNPFDHHVERVTALVGSQKKKKKRH